MKISILVPIKRLDISKQRLSSVLSVAARKALVIAMAHDVMTALTEAKSVAEIVVVTCDPVAASVARPFGARILTEGADDGHSHAIRTGVEALRDAGAEDVMTVPIDVPLVTAQEIDTVADNHPRKPGFSIVPARDRFGSNCILSSPPGIVQPMFGPGSFESHCAAARSAGAEVRILELPGLGLDIDTPEDIEAFMRIGQGTHTAAIVADAMFSFHGGAAL